MNYRSEDVNELFGALCKAQAEMEVAGLTSANPFFKSRYADFTTVVKASRPALTKNGLCVTQLILSNDEGHSVLHTILGHSSGQYIETRIKMTPAKNDVQSWASCLTYLKRYTYAAMVGITTGEEDDDGEAAVAETRKPNYSAPKPPERPAPMAVLEYVTTDQLQDLEAILDGFPDLAERMLKSMKIERLADVQKKDFRAIYERIRDIKMKEHGQ